MKVFKRVTRIVPSREVEARDFLIPMLDFKLSRPLFYAGVRRILKLAPSDADDEARD